MSKLLIQDTNIAEETNLINSSGDSVPEPAQHHFLRQLKCESTGYVLQSGEVDVTSMLNFIDYAAYIASDYIWVQLRIQEILDAKAGATATDRWSNCSDAEKDYIIFYNQHKGAAGDGDKVGYMIPSATYPTVVDVPTAAVHLKLVHAQSLNRAKPAARARVDSEILVNRIITYLSSEDTQALMATVQNMLANYKDFVLIGSIIPDNEDGLRDYIESTSGYLGNGLVEENWVVLNPPKTLSELRDDLVNLLFGNNEF